MFIQKANSDFTLIIFGASGNLAKLKIFPAIYELFLQKRLDGVDFNVVGFARSEISDEEFRKIFIESVQKKYPEADQSILLELASKVYYFAGQYDDASSYEALLGKLKGIENSENVVRISYFSVPPTVFSNILENIANKFDTAKQKQRVILEKPFGNDEKSALKLQGMVLDLFDEEQVFLLDHYLGKEAIFNLLALRYANPILRKLFEPGLIDNIQITSYEDIGIEKRAGYFDNVGIFKDMVQSHMMQILAFLLMDLPKKVTTDSVHRNKRHLLESLVIHDYKKSICVGQYEGYLQEEGVAANSHTETFAALRLYLDKTGYGQVPIYLRSGKKLNRKLGRVVIEFKQTCLEIEEFDVVDRNRLIIELQPNEGIEFDISVKQGGADFNVKQAKTSTELSCQGDCLAEHGRLLLEAMSGRRMLFLSFGEIQAAWHLADKVTEIIEDEEVKLSIYKPGSLGPECINNLVKQDGFAWYNND